MKRKIALASTVFAALFLAAFIALYCMQTAIVDSALKSSNPGSKIENASIGFFSTTISGLEIETKDGSKLRVEKAEASHAFLIKCLFAKKLDIENLKISGAVFSQSEKPRKPEAPKGEKEEEKGFFESFDLSVKSLEADIELRLACGAKIKAEIGGENPARNIAASEIFKLHSADLRFPAEVECGGEKFEVYAQILARGTPQQSRLEARADLAGKTVFLAEMNASGFYKKIGAKAQILINSADLKSLAEGLPQMSLNLHSSAVFDGAFNNAECDLSMRADFENLREFSVYFDDVKTSSIAAEISLAKSGGEIYAKKLAAGLGVNGSPAFSIGCAKEFKLDIFNISKFPDSPLLELSLNRFDLGLLNAFIKQSGFEVSASPVSGSIEISKNGGAVEAKCKNPILVKNLSIFRNGSALISGASFSLSASGSTDFKKSGAAMQISPIKSDSDFAATLEFDADSGSKTIRLQAGGNPSPLFPRAKECGAEKAEADALVLIKDGVANIKNFEICVSGKNGAGILRAKSKSEFSIGLSGPDAAAQNAEIEISSDCLPPEILSAALPGASAEKFGFFASVKIKGDKSAASVFSANAKNFSYSDAENHLLQNLNLELEGSADFSDGLLKVEAEKFRVLENATGILTSSGSAVFAFDFSSPPIFKSGKFEASASIPKMMQQPALKPFDNAASGLLEISASADSENIELCAAVSNLSARGYADLLGRASLDAKASLKDFSPQKAAAKFRIATTKGETLAFADAEFSDSVFAKIDAEKIVAEDVQTLVEAFINRLPAQTQKGRTKYIRPKTLKNAENLPDSKQIRSSIKKKLLPHETQGGPEADAKPGKSPQVGEQIADVKIEELPQLETRPAAWHLGKDLNAKISARQIIKGGEKILENLSAEIFIGKNSAKISEASALFYGAPAQMAAEAGFANNLYSLKNASLEIKGLSVENLLEKNGDNKAFLEGKFDIRADFFSSGKTPEDMLRRARFNIAAETKGGTLHFVDKSSEYWEMAAMGADMLKLGGTIFGGKVRDIGDAAEAMRLLADLDFSAASLRLSRAENLDIILSPIEIKSQDAVLSMSGTLAYVEGESIKDMPILLPIKLRPASARLSKILQKIGYSDGEADSWPQFQITGTLAKPKNNIAEILAAAARSVLKSKN